MKLPLHPLAADGPNWQLVDSDGRLVAFRLTAAEANELTNAVRFHRPMRQLLAALLEAFDGHNAEGTLAVFDEARALLGRLCAAEAEPCE